MLLLRILTLPIAMLAFSVLYCVSIKVPQAVEVANIVLWIALPVTAAIALIGRALLHATKGN